MLVTFTSKVHADVVMFGDIAGRFLQIMGESQQPPGILRGEKIREAAERLRTWLDHVAPESAPPEVRPADADDKKLNEDDKERRNKVGLKIRAVPLLELMDKSYAREVDVIWR
jgi:hypothetical protein